MFKLSFLILALLVALNILAQTSPHEEKLSIKCDVCHTSKNWKTIKIKSDSFNHDKTRFPLVGQHKMVNCKSCHKDLTFANTKTSCISCHIDIHEQTLGRDCERCHTPISWEVNNITKIHEESGFPLQGNHALADCYQCHKSASQHRYNPMRTTCYDCHSKEYNETKNPSHLALNYPRDCNMCHNSTDWNSATFNHNATNFPLRGSHNGLECTKCHSTGIFNRLPTNCVSCHLNDYNSSKSPEHAKANFSKECETCHTEINWKPSTFNHNTATVFPLKGAHVGVDCSKCHGGGYSNIPTTCVSCHQTDYNTTVSPAHAAAKFSNECQTCHTETAWKPSTFIHNTATSFPLTGGHVGVDCISCHKTGVFNGLPTTCVSCHLSDYNTAVDPNHISTNFSKDCQTCHNNTAWQPTTFNHNTNTSFPLKGAHIAVACKSCHATKYTGTSTACVSCHQTDYNTTVSPAHAAAKFSNECQICHTETAWKPSTFSHNTATSFPLTGGHVGVDCISCHKTGVFNGLPTTCVSCHLKDYNTAVDPNHISASFSKDCQTCHNISAWQPTTFNHNTNTSFPLKGAHIAVACKSCHATKYTETSTACVSCHQTDYNTTVSPAHAAAKFSNECQTCHTETAWKPSTFSHNTATSFPLTGGHVGVDCISCHKTGVFNGLPTTCVSCHLSDYNTAVDPNHISTNFSKDCQTCHNNTAWQPTTFNHNTNTSFPLKGAHIAVACKSCHATKYTGTSTACVSCHQTDYNTTVSPAHAAAKFSNECQTCHTETAWKPSTFNHDTQYFRIYSGRHREQWSQCTECHTNASNFSAFSCIVCHQHSNKASVDADHREKPGYVYSATSCFDCHRGV